MDALARRVENRIQLKTHVFLRKMLNYFKIDDDDNDDNDDENGKIMINFTKSFISER